MRFYSLLFILGIFGSFASPTNAQNWSYTTPLDAPRVGAAVAVLDEVIYVMGGEDGQGQILDSVVRYDPKVGLWERAPSMTHPRAYGAAVTYQDMIFVIGGRNALGEVLNEVEFFNPALQTWQPFQQMDKRRQGLVAAVWNDVLFVAGGSDEDDELLDSITFFDDAQQHWVDLDDDDGRIGEIELQGQIQTLGPTSLMVNDTTFTVTGETEILSETNMAVSFSALAVGQQVRINADVLEDGSFLATRIKIEDDILPDQLDLTGAIQSLSADALVVNDTSILTTVNTIFLDENDNPTTFSVLEVGFIVRVQAVRGDDNLWYASEIKVEDDGLDGPIEVEVEGQIQALTANTLTVNAIVFVVNDATEILDPDNNPLAFDALILDQLVDIRADRYADNTHIATRIRVQEEENNRVLQACESTVDLIPGDTFNIRDYVQFEDDTPVQDWSTVLFTYTEAGANDPTNPPDWNLAAFNAGQPVTITAADAAEGTGNRGDGEYRIYMARTGQSSFDDHMTFRIDPDEDESEVEEARCDNQEQSDKVADFSQLGTPRASFGGVVVDNEVMVYVGGFGRLGPLSLVQKVEPGGTIAELPPLPTARGGLAAASWKREVYAIGGRDVEDQTLADVDVFNLDTETWRSLPRLNEARQGSAAIAVGGILYVVGGRSSRGRALETVESFPLEVAVTSSELPPPGPMLALEGNYPNPLQRHTTFLLSVSARTSSDPISLTIYDVQGRLVARLLDALLPAGTHELTWDGTDSQGHRLSSGVYLCRLQQGTHQAHHLLTIMR